MCRPASTLQRAQGSTATEKAGADLGGRQLRESSVNESIGEDKTSPSSLALKRDIVSPPSFSVELGTILTNNLIF